MTDPVKVIDVVERVNAVINQLTEKRLLKRQAWGLAQMMCDTSAGRVETLKGYTITWERSINDHEVTIYCFH